METVKEKLEYLIIEAVELYPSEYETLLDHLIQNGVTILECGMDCKSCWKTKIVNPVQGWVSVDERKPEEDENIMPYKDGRLFFVSVLAYGKERGVRIVNRLRVDKVGIPYLDKDATDGWEWSLGCEDVTHWMPLPAPPKGDNSNE